MQLLLVDVLELVLVKREYFFVTEDRIRIDPRYITCGRTQVTDKHRLITDRAGDSQFLVHSLDMRAMQRLFKGVGEK